MWRASDHPLREQHGIVSGGTTYVFVQDTQPTNLRKSYKFSLGLTVPPSREAALAAGASLNLPPRSPLNGYTL